MEYRLIDLETLRKFIHGVFAGLSFSEEECSNAARVLTLSDLRGVESHGCARLHGYVRLVDAGKIKPNAKPFIEREFGSTATLDGDSGLGLHVATKAAEIAIDKAKKHGSGWVSVKNSSHFGVAVGHVLPALEEGLIGFSLTNASPLVAPAGGKDRLLGTNPICIAFPAKEKAPFICDMATTVVANGKLEVAKRKGVDIPLGYAQDKNGQTSPDPSILSQGGSMLPLGGSLDHSSYKGYALGSVVDILTGVLSGANYGPWVPPFVPFLNQVSDSVGQGIGHFVGAWSVEGFIDTEEFKERMDHWMETFSKSNPAEGIDKVWIPGEKEHELSIERREKGIPVHRETWKTLEELDQRFNLNML